MTARPITVEFDAIVDAEFLADCDDTDVCDPKTSARKRADSRDERAALSLREADRVSAWTRAKIARNIRERGVAMNADVIACLIEAGRL